MKWSENAAVIVETMSFNLRYWNKGDGDNAWPYRQSAVVSIIQEYKPVILGTQEGLPAMLAGLDRALPEYRRFGIGRDKGGGGEHNAVYYRTDAAKLLEHGQFWLSKEPTKSGSRSWDSSLPRICTWGILQSQTGEQQFAVFNTHLDHEGEDARRCGAQLIWERMTPLVEQGMPCILMGDFNCQPHSTPVQFFRSRLQDVLWEMDAGGATFHGFTGLGIGGWIDYIFATRNIQVVEAEIIRKKVDGRFPSDHYPIRARLLLPPRP